MRLPHVKKHLIENFVSFSVAIDVSKRAWRSGRNVIKLLAIEYGIRLNLKKRTTWIHYLINLFYSWANFSKIVVAIVFYNMANLGHFFSFIFKFLSNFIIQ